ILMTLHIVSLNAAPQHVVACPDEEPRHEIKQISPLGVERGLVFQSAKQVQTEDAVQQPDEIGVPINQTWFDAYAAALEINDADPALRMNLDPIWNLQDLETAARDQHL